MSPTQRTRPRSPPAREHPALERIRGAAVPPGVAVCVVYVAAMFMNGVDSTIVNVALPAIGADLGVPPGATGAINIGYLVSLAVCIPVSGWLGDRFGTKRTFLTAFGVFVAASALCGSAGSIGELTTFRVLQGAGGGVMTPVALTLLFRAYPPEQRIQLSRVLMVPTALAPALGPVLGGFFTEQLSWRWGFLVNVPIGIGALAFGARYLVGHAEPSAGRFDLVGFALAVPGIGGVMYALQAGARDAWTAPSVLLAGFGGLAALAVLTRVELRAHRPMLRLRLLGDVSFRRAGALLCLCMAGFLGALYVFPLMYQGSLGATPWQTGLVTMPKAFGLMAASQVVKPAHARIGPRGVVAVAAGGAAVSFLLMTTLSAASGGGAATWLAGTLQFTSGFFVGAASIELQVVAFTTIDGPMIGAASTLFNVQRQLGSAIGVAVAAMVLASGTATSGGGGVPQPSPAGYHTGMIVAALFVLACGVLALRLPAAPTGNAGEDPDPADAEPTAG